MRSPAECRTMEELRAEIDRLDSALVDLLTERSAFIDRAAELKLGLGLPGRIGSRIEEVVAHVRARAETRGLDPVLAETLWRALIEWAIAREEKVLGKGEE